jgi:succinate dehydrogenase / fumarate reductase cytochrome b subunit
LASFLTTVRGYLFYRGREGHLGFLLHRITGLGTLLFLAIHIVDTALVYFAPDLYNEALDIYRSTLFGFGEIALVFSVLYHGVNGLRLAIFDLFAARMWNIPFERSSVRFTMAVTLLFWIPATIVMLRSMLIHNFGMFGG